MAIITSRKLLAVSGGEGLGGERLECQMFRAESCLSSSWSVLVPNTWVPKTREKIVNPTNCFLLMAVVQSGKKGLLHTSKGFQAFSSCMEIQQEESNVFLTSQAMISSE